MPNVMAAQPIIGGALCESSVIPFLVPRLKVWLRPAAAFLCILYFERSACSTFQTCILKSH